MSSLSPHLPAAEAAASSSDDRRPAFSRGEVLGIAGLVVAFTLLACWRLGEPGRLVFDEVFHVRTALDFLHGTPPHDVTHPQLGKLLIALGAWFGQVAWPEGPQAWAHGRPWPVADAFAWRFPVALCGGLCVALTYALARALFGRRRLAFFAAALLMLDGDFFVLSRIGMLNVPELAFLLTGALGLVLHLKTERRRWLFLAGLGFGCGIATRWAVLFPWAFAWAVLWGRLAWRFIRGGERPTACRLAGLVALHGSAMLALPLIVYVLSYVPVVLQGDGSWAQKLVSWNGHPQGWAHVVALQQEMWNYHKTYGQTMPIASPWWSWPLMLKPELYFLRRTADGLVATVWNIGNVFIWWASVPALAAAAWFGWRRRSLGLGLVAMWGLGQWLMWGIQPRPLVMMHYMLESIPFACIAIAYGLDALWRRSASRAPLGGPEAAAPRGMGLGQLAVVSYLGLVAWWFSFYYPLLAAQPVYERYFAWHIWLPGHWP